MSLKHNYALKSFASLTWTVVRCAHARLLAKRYTSLSTLLAGDSTGTCFRMRIRLKSLILVVLALLTQSCATYVPPNSGSLARIQFLGNQYYAYIDEGNSCGSRHFVTKEFWMGTNLRAGQRVWIEQGIDTSGLPLGVQCGLAYSFEPVEGQSYVSEYYNDGLKCRIAVYRLEGATRMPVKTVRRESQKFCAW